MMNKNYDFLAHTHRTGNYPDLKFNERVLREADKKKNVLFFERLEIF